MLRLVLRPLLVILTLGALFIALFQVVGRIAFSFLDDLQPLVNDMLQERGIRVTGLSGDWRMLNPILNVERVELPAGHLQGLVLELDMVGTVLHSTPLARRLRVADADLVLEKAPGEPWRLRGAAGAGDFDPGPFLEHSDQLELDGRLRFAREGLEPAAIDFSYLGINRGGEHRHGLDLSNAADDCPQRCTLRVDYHREDGLWPLRAERTRLSARGDGFLLPRPILGVSPLELAHLELRWQRLGRDSGGTMSVRTEQLDMPGDATLATELAGTLRGRDGSHRGSISRWRVEQGDDVWSLPEVALNAADERVSLWMPSLDIERAAGFLRQVLAAVEPAHRWLGALDLRGTARNVRLAYGLQGEGLSYALTLDQAAMDGYKGVPTVVDAGGELFGYEQGLQLNLNAQGMELAFPDVFSDRWHLPYAQGVVQAWFGRDYFGVRGLHLRAETAGSRAAGGFAMSRPPDREGQRLLMLLSTDRIPVAQAQRFVPYKLPAALKDWLQTAPRGGVLERVSLAYQGQFQEDPGELGRRIELAARVRDGELRYHPDWPTVTKLRGQLAVAGATVLMDVAEAQTAGAGVDGSRVRLVDNAAAVQVSLDADADAAAVLDFLRNTPLSEALAFVEPDWRASGSMRLSGELQVPLNAGEAAPPAVRLRVDLAGVDLRLPGYRVGIDALDGSFRYRYPYQFDASGVTGRLFDAPVTLAAGTRGERVHLRFSGRARPEHVWQIIDMRDPGIASGAASFDADLGIGVTENAVTELAVSTPLEGIELRLPAGYGKPAAGVVPAEVRVAFLPEHRSIRFDYRGASGWLHFDEAPLRGAIAFDDLPLAEQDVEDALVLGGRLDGFDLADVVPQGEGGAAAPQSSWPLPIELERLHVGAIGIGDFEVTRATLDGRITPRALDLTVDSAEVSGTLGRQGDAPLQVALDRVTVPAGDGAAAAEDPLSPPLIAELPAADVEIGQLTLGTEDYGRWRFSMRPERDALVVTGLEASVKGVDIRAPEGLVWHGDRNETRFQGRLVAGDLAAVLPRWGYAPSVETDSARLAGTFSWAGSPLMVDLLALRGEGSARARQGRFVDVESGAAGAQKIFSLLNFTAIAKRLSLNFSDVFGRGVSFDDLQARFALDEGLLTFLEPMEVEGTGSEFRVTGTVDLAEGRLDNEMLVTLPVSKSLPWYAAYVALANPLAGLGVLVGERVLRKPLEQFSSARYHIGGTLDDPEVTFVSVFDVTPAEPAAVGQESAPPGSGAAQNDAPDEGEPAVSAGAEAERDAPQARHPGDSNRLTGAPTIHD